MSKATRAFFEGLKDMVGDGLSNIIPDLKAELGRLGTHGAVELGQALFNGQAFTPYGPGENGGQGSGHDDGGSAGRQWRACRTSRNRSAAVAIYASTLKGLINDHASTRAADRRARSLPSAVAGRNRRNRLAAAHGGRRCVLVSAASFMLPSNCPRSQTDAEKNSALTRDDVMALIHPFGESARKYVA